MDITPFLWFDRDLREVVDYYAWVFGDAALIETADYPEGGTGPVGELMTARFSIAGQDFLALNGGPQEFSFNESISFMIGVDTQEEIDTLWERLSAEGRTSMCGWVADRYGVWWQVVPHQLGGLIGDPDPAKASRATKAMLAMTKLDIAELQRAHAGG